MEQEPRGGGQNASLDASQSSATTSPKSGPKTRANDQAKRPTKLISIIGKALERLSLSQEEQAAWEAIKSLAQGSDRATASSLELLQI